MVKEITSGFHFVLSFSGKQARRMDIASVHFWAQVSLQELPLISLSRFVTTSRISGTFEIVTKLGGGRGGGIR